MRRILIGIVIVIAIMVIVIKSLPRENMTTLQGNAMGTTWKLVCHDSPPELLHQEIAATLEEWEQVMSTWREGSDISRYNQGENATPELQRVIDLANRMKQETNGAFDPHVLEAVNQAGFGPPGKGIDLSGIGKGFAVDRIGELLRERGITHFIFEFGGEILAGDGDWKCEVTNPIPTQPPYEIRLSNQAIATSGNYYQFHSSEGKTITHIIDPSTQSPIDRSPMQSVTVFAETCAEADAWATALFVIGPHAAPKDTPSHLWLPPYE